MSSSKHGSASDLDTTATRLAARVPYVPVRLSAVDRAGLCAASLVGKQDRAGYTTVFGHYYDTAAAGSVAGSTGLRASRPGRPLGCDTVNGACLGVADTFFVLGACSTPVRSGNLDNIVAKLLTSTASLGALAPCIPDVDTVDGARLNVAILLLYDVSTFGATVCSFSDNSTAADLNATTANFSASRPCTPWLEHTINGAILLGTRADLLVGRHDADARLATVLGLADD